MPTPPKTPKVHTAKKAPRAKSNPPKPPPTVDTLSREAYLRDALQGTRRDLERARSRDAFTAVSVLIRQERELREDLDRLLADSQKEADDTEGFGALERLSEDELMRMQVEAMRELPAHLLEPLAVVLLERLGASTLARLQATKGLRLVEGKP